jgi:hypothetical protein
MEKEKTDAELLLEANERIKNIESGKPLGFPEPLIAILVALILFGTIFGAAYIGLFWF